MSLNGVRCLKDIYECLNVDDESKVRLFQEEGLLRKLKRCSKCKRQEVLYKNDNYKGNYAAYCKTCKNFFTLTNGSFFDSTNLSFEEILAILWLWACDTPPSVATNITGINHAAIIQYYRFFRDICSWKLINTEWPKLGGAGHVVQIDESVITKRKYNRGRMVKEQWVVGMLDTETREGVIVYVDRRNRETLLQLIQKHVKVGSIIWTDMWKGYNGLDNLGYVHETVNHAEEFVSNTGVCTNAVEGHWSVLKGFLRRKNVLWSKLLPEHVDEFMWKQRFNGTPSVYFQHMLQHFKEKYLC